MRRATTVAVLLAGLLACGRTSGTVEIPPEELPFSVARASNPVETSGPARAVTLYFVRENRLVRVRREIRTDVDPAEAVLRALLEGPTARERRQGIGTELPTAVRLLEVRIEPDTTHVDLSAEFQEPAPPELIALRVAQVVWTLTEFPAINAIRFSIDGEEIAVSAAGGTADDRPVVRADYGVLAPP